MLSRIQLILPLISLVLVGCGSRDSSDLDGDTFNEHIYWEKDLAIGDEDKFKISIHPVIKNSGAHKNRKSVSRFSADGWIFGYKLPFGKEETTEGQLIDLAAIINRGELTSYSYVRVLDETKWEHHSPEPRLQEKFARNLSADIEYPVLMGGIVGNLSVKGSLAGLLSTNLVFSSPDEWQLEAGFKPHLNVVAKASTEAKTNFWLRAEIAGQVDIVDYGFDSALIATYEPDTRELSSDLIVDDHKIEGLGGKLSVMAEMGPDSDASELTKGLWTSISNNGEILKYSHVIYEKEQSLFRSIEPINLRSSIILDEEEYSSSEKSIPNVDCSQSYDDVMEEANSVSDPSERDSLIDEALNLMIYCGV